jgi:hypothetical protein
VEAREGGGRLLVLEGGCSIEAGGGGVEWRGGEEVLSLFAVGPFGIVFCLTNTLSLTLHTLALSLSLSQSLSLALALSPPFGIV